MNIKRILFNFFLRTFTILSYCGVVNAADWQGEFYSQNVYLHKYKNMVSQNLLTLAKDLGELETYGGLWFEHDDKTDAKESYVDAQVSPLLGLRSKVFGNEWMYSRAFTEGRLVHRTKPFPDDRVRTTYEARAGIVGYGLKLWDSPFFLENYYSLFYTRLYGDRIIFQGWARQGLRFFKHWEILNEFFVDTFDFTRDSDATYDLRPGVRFRYDFKGGSLQLIHQRLHHFSNLSFSGRNESRTTLVIGYYW